MADELFGHELFAKPVSAIGISFQSSLRFRDGGVSLQTEKPLRILIAEDPATDGRAFASVIDGQPGFELVGTAADGAVALQVARRRQPHIVLLDLRTPRLDGPAVTRQILRDCPETQVIVMAAFDADQLMFDCICAGAQAFLPGDSGDAEILATIAEVSRGESRLAPGLTRKLIDEFRRLCLATCRGEASYCSPGEPLTERENRIVQLIVAGKGNKDIALALKLAEGTVKNYVSRILEKLNARSRTELAVKALKRRDA